MINQQLRPQFKISIGDAYATVMVIAVIGFGFATMMMELCFALVVATAMIVGIGTTMIAASVSA